MSDEQYPQITNKDESLAQLAEHFKIEGWCCSPNNVGYIAIFRRCYAAQYSGCAECADERIASDVSKFLEKREVLPTYVLRTWQRLVTGALK